MLLHGLRKPPSSIAVSGAGAFFVGSDPGNVSLAFMVGALCSDAIGLISAYHECSQILTLLLIWIIFFTFFAPNRVPGFFLVMRGICFATGVELRFAIVRRQNLVPAVTIIGLPILLLIVVGKGTWRILRKCWRFRRMPQWGSGEPNSHPNGPTSSTHISGLSTWV